MISFETSAALARHANAEDRLLPCNWVPGTPQTHVDRDGWMAVVDVSGILEDGLPCMEVLYLCTLSFGHEGTLGCYGGQ